MRLTKTTSHAIRIAIDCAEAGGALVKVADISQRLDITPLNVFKIVHLLSRAGFVEAVRGRSGGVRLAKAAEMIRIGDIVRVMEATQMDVAGAEPADQRPKRGPKADLNVIFDDALEAFVSVLDHYSLADMAKNAREKPARKIAAPRKTRARTATATVRRSIILRE